MQDTYYNLPLPNWTQSFYNTEKVLELTEEILTFHTATDELKKLRLSPLLKVLINNMNSKIDGNKPDRFPNMSNSRRKMILFSGHDYTMTHLMRTIGLYDSVRRRPGYASALMIELHKNGLGNGSDSYFIKVQKYKFSATVPISHKTYFLSFFA